MINDIDIRNFKCFERLSISNCNRINVIVGDNGAGKTALLEAIFLALGGSSQLAIRFRQFRGLDGTFRGDGRKIEEAILRDYFHNLDMSKQISITLSGSGPEARSVYIGRKDSGPETFFSGTDLSSADIKSSIEFRWRDARGNERTASPTFSAENVKFPETGEDLPNFFFFAANQTFSSVENAERFSDLSRAKRVLKFAKIITDQYQWIEDLSIEVLAGAPAVYASVKGLPDKLPITSISGGVNRLITVLLALASRQQSILCVDEMENGLFHTHHAAFWGGLLSFARDYNGQLFLTTHSEEWISAMYEAAGSHVEDISVWRIERGENGHPEIFQFEGDTPKAGIDAGVDMRGYPE